MFIASTSQLKPSFRALFNQAEIMLANGKQLDVEVKEHKHRRTLEQNNYYWEFCEQFAKFLQEKEIMKKYEVLGVQVERFFTKEDVHKDLNKPLLDVKSTKNMSIGEFCEYMNKLLLYWNERTKGEFQMSELPANYLERKGYTI